MSWRNQGITGSNNIPLGRARRFGGDVDDNVMPEDNHDLKRGRDPEPRTEADGPRRRKKRNRWGDASENKAAGLMGLATAITASMTSEQLDAYTLHLRIEEISQKLRIDDVVPADGDRYGSAYSFRKESDVLLIFTDRPRRHQCMTITVNVSTPERIATERNSRTNATNLLRRP